MSRFWAGTDVRFALGDFPILEEYGFVDQPGRRDHWPSGFLATWADEALADGCTVLDRGDICRRGNPMCGSRSVSPPNAASSPASISI